MSQDEVYTREEDLQTEVRQKSRPEEYLSVVRNEAATLLSAVPASQHLEL